MAWTGVEPAESGLVTLSLGIKAVAVAAELELVLGTATWLDIVPVVVDSPEAEVGKLALGVICKTDLLNFSPSVAADKGWEGGTTDIPWVGLLMSVA